MNDEPALLRAILERPDDDLARMIYADWCDDNGQPERAKFIRDSLLLARNPHIGIKPTRLSKKFAREWFWPPEWDTKSPKYPIVELCGLGNDTWISRTDKEKVLVKNGFIRAVVCDLNKWVSGGKRLVRNHPITSLQMQGSLPVSHKINGEGAVWRQNYTSERWPTHRDKCLTSIFRYLDRYTLYRNENIGLVSSDSIYHEYVYDTYYHAHSAFVKACLNWARQEDDVS